MGERKKLHAHFLIFTILASIFCGFYASQTHGKSLEKEKIVEEPLDFSFLKKDDDISFGLKWSMKIDDIEKVFKKKPSINHKNELFLFEDVHIEGFKYPPFQVTIDYSSNSGNLNGIQFSFEFNKENLKNSRGEFDTVELYKIRQHFEEYFLIKYRFIKSEKNSDDDGAYASHIFKQADYLIEFRTVTQKQKAVFIVEYTKASYDLGF